MSTRKIIFLIVVSLVGVLLIYLLWNLSQAQQKKKAAAVTNISLWVVGDTSEQFQKIFDEFKMTDPRFIDTIINIRVFPDYEKYQRILLSTLSEGVGPDIFMIEGGGDDILATKAEPIPDSLIDLSQFEKTYEDIFLPLLKTEGEGKEITRSLLGVPLGYETLGLFYHKSLLGSIPKTWSELQMLNLENNGESIYTTNLGLGPSFTPYATDIISYFLGKNGIRTHGTITEGGESLSEYMSYAGFTPKERPSDLTQEGGGQVQLIDMRADMSTSLLSTTDLFMRGKIAILVGYPGLIREIEKAEKRAEKEKLDDLILTEKIPQDSLGKNKTNIARFKYLAVSKKSENGLPAASFLSYIMSDAGSAVIREAFPLLLSPQRGQAGIQKDTPLSKVFARTRLDAFIPDLQDDIFVYNYGLKSEYEKIYRDYIDRNAKIDITKIIQALEVTIPCEVGSVLSGSLDEKCLTNESI